ncbi:MAE_28990/MAE_18760 family HEPN-like nuclease [Nonomuraea sp. NBC_01738]|uniref:MAE_28990/MAE_18760 family HEPN-like nuclease n=1 Tax=Nonomuraea sp. NBC_01738 TaxID=2976003 RepID=UPI002E10DBD1|nr:MAE_28990/MAE_18760 family HEPN-like nuclease [Nonomuraea sp. NBC_01738]
MKIRTAEELHDRIADEQAWRKKELGIFRSQVETAEWRVRPALLRSSVALLYAHWEGFVKTVGHYYLCYLSSLKLTYQQLRPEIAAFALRTQINNFTQSERPHIHAGFVRTLREAANDRAKIPSDRDAIRTRSNLNYETLVDILCALGCDHERYADESDLIDGQLVARRNRVVHGEEDYIHLSEWDELYREVLTLMEDIAVQILNAAVEKTYFAWRS